MPHNPFFLPDLYFTMHPPFALRAPKLAALQALAGPTHFRTIGQFHDLALD